jgi:RHH-type proline utilization regulon transcriptional repressor/proline dehydrogenase/delta 1-pyrroline-5-carboxylate dehydrogenase
MTAYIEAAEAEGRLLHQVPRRGRAISSAPALIRVRGIADLEREVFGPVLHVATFKGRGHRPRDRRHQRHRLRPDLRPAHPHRHAGGGGRARRPGRQCLRQPQPDRRGRRQPALRRHGPVGHRSEGGRPGLCPRFCRAPSGDASEAPGAAGVGRYRLAAVSRRCPPGRSPRRHQPPGPTGESNRYSTVPRGPILCLGPGRDAALEQAAQARAQGCPALAVAPGSLRPKVSTAPRSRDARHLPGIAASPSGGRPTARALRQALAAAKARSCPSSPRPISRPSA